MKVLIYFDIFCSGYLKILTLLYVSLMFPASSEAARLSVLITDANSSKDVMTSTAKPLSCK